MEHYTLIMSARKVTSISIQKRTHQTYERINFTGRQARTYRARRREDEQTEQEGPKAELPYAALYHDEGLMGDLSCVLSNEDARASEDVRRQGDRSVVVMLGSVSSMSSETRYRLSYVLVRRARSASFVLHLIDPFE